MIQKVQSVGNGKIMVSYMLPDEAVIVQVPDGCVYIRPKFFSGIPNLKERYNEFEDGILDETSFNDAVEFFTPNMLQTFVNEK